MTVPPASTNFFTFASAPAPPPEPAVTWQRLRRSGSLEGAAPAVAGGSASPPPRPPPKPPPARNDAPEGMMMTSYFDRRFVSSNPAPPTIVNGNSERSRRNRVQPDGIDPVAVSQSAMRCGASFAAPPRPGGIIVASTLTPSSWALFCTIAVDAVVAATYSVPAGNVLPLSVSGEPNRNTSPFAFITRLAIVKASLTAGDNR